MKGYVRKRGNKWSYTVDTGRDPITNKRKQKTKGGFATKKEATAAMNEVIYELNKGIWIEPQHTLLQDFAIEWLVNHRHGLRGTTFEQYETKIVKWINPLLGKMKLQDIKPVHIQKFANQLLEHMKPNTARKNLSVLKMILKNAVELEVISKNPADRISIRESKRKVATWTFEELSHFLSVVKQEDTFYHDVFATAAFTGLRKGEVLGLKRSNVDLRNNLITITQSIAESKEKGAYISELKTPSSYRHVAVDPFLTSILKERIKKNNEMRLKFGPEYKDDDLVFCHLDGMMIRPTSLNRPFRKFIEIAGVPYIRFHDMRHTHATLLLMDLKANPKAVADRLGHSSAKITLDTYTHPSMEVQSDMAEQFSKKARKG
jgi:integrase